MDFVVPCLRKFQMFGAAIYTSRVPPVYMLMPPFLPPPTLNTSLRIGFRVIELQ